MVCKYIYKIEKRYEEQIKLQDGQQEGVCLTGR
jgi:hypothetical protein